MRHYIVRYCSNCSYHSKVKYFIVLTPRVKRETMHYDLYLVDDIWTSKINDEVKVMSRLPFFAVLPLLRVRTPFTDDDALLRRAAHVYLLLHIGPAQRACRIIHKRTAC